MPTPLVVLKFKFKATGLVEEIDLELSTFSRLFAAFAFLPFFVVLKVINFLLITFIRLFYEAELELLPLFV